ncbi:MAG: D-arabinose 5-phosphate isomerase [Gammaproteobacteria bacterium]|nr:D-arabinose 5-phosphate isomerase [Gammaproteobacteria bacterium]
MKKINKILVAKKVIKSEGKSLIRVADKINKEFVKACDAILCCKGKVVTIGLGKSGHIAAKAAATLSSTGTPSTFLHAADALHGDMGAITKNDIVIFYSNSGETKELMFILPLLKLLKLPIITITGSRSSTLSKSSDIVIDSGVNVEACPLNLTPTSSVITAIGISDALAITLLECRGFTSKDFAKSHPQGTLGKRLLKKSVDIMFKTKMPVIDEMSKLTKAINVISKYNYGVVIALNKDKKVSGIFTDGDLRRTLKKFGDVRSLILKNVMSKNPITVTTDILAAEALNIMEEREITCLIVKNKNKTLSGLLTLNQILKVGIE